MKRIVAVIITLGMIAGNSFAAFDAFSFRMQGINPILTGILADEYTDVRAVNVADILNISGYRFYTQFANLSGKGDQLFNDDDIGVGGNVANDAFQFGFIGNPLKNILPDGQMGLLLEQASRITPGNAGGFGGAGSGEASNHTVVNTDNSAPADNDFTDAGDTTVITDMTGERYVETGNNDITVYVGNPVSDRLKIGIGVGMNIMTSEEPINATYGYVATAVAGVTTDTENNSRKAKEEINTSIMQLNLGLRYAMNDQWDIGGTLIYAPQTTERKRSSVATFNRNTSAGAGADPTILTATGTDGSEITAALGGLPAHFATTDGATDIIGGFNWTNNAAFVTGVGMDDDAVGKLEDDGAGITISVDSHYKLNEDLTLVGRLTSINIPLDRKLDARNYVTANVRSWIGLSTNDVFVIDNETTYKGSGDNKTTGLGVTFGAEQDLPSNVKLGYGVVYSLVTEEVDMAYTVSMRNVATYDATNDGLKLGAGTALGDWRTTTTQTDKYTSNSETVTTAYLFPIGLELQPFKKLKVRLGVTHAVINVVTKTESKQTEAGLGQSYNEAGAVAPTTTYAGGAATTGDTVVYTETTDKERETQYFYGIGYQWNENLSFDILNFSGAGSGGGLLDLASWRIGATLLFGAPEEL